ncbi:MAG: adenylosuccinate lyase [Acidobacteria bacterium]|nr:adenylosuccinate lyase [Acidobacteriota bacterium]MBI3657185.1 adenylosuccinate lyase [Acidobacteriota bacterium]
MISRYTAPAMAKIWTEENKFRKWLQVEIAVCEALMELGEMPASAFETIKEKANFSMERIAEIERSVKHDVLAFITSVAEFVGPEARHIHWGLTSTDVVDTAQALLVKEASEIILTEMRTLAAAIRHRAFEHKNTVMVGRTHGIHAEVTTFGLKLAIWYDEMRRNIIRVERATEHLRYGKISGAVGTFAHLSPKVEEMVCATLGLRHAPASNQVLQRDSHAEYIAALAITASSYDQFATEIRHLQRTEVREVEEPFADRQQGSSAMPHKKNPITCEQISGLARILRSYVQASLENIPLWHERDISHSSVERIILPDSTTLIHYLSRQMASVMQGLIVHPERMLQNINLTNGLIFSGQILLELTRKEISRGEAYTWVQRSALRVWDENIDFQTAILTDPQIPSYLSEAEIMATFNLKNQLKNVDYIFHRVFDEEPC